jgi:ABC-2 type transport system permease protein
VVSNFNYLFNFFLFSTAGFINAVYAKSFDDINIVTTFVLTPLTYLGGTFYSIDALPQVWQDISVFNPIAYIISSYRLAFLGLEETSLVLSLSISCCVDNNFIFCCP